MTDQFDAGLVGRASAALAFGRIGDAMGTPTENLEPEVIRERFGWIDTFEGDGTDDTIMAQLIADALIRTDGHATADDWARECLDHSDRIFGDKLNKFFVTVVHSMRKLEYGWIPRQIALGNLPSSSSAMAIVPVGIVNAGNPRAAALQAADIASFLHTHDVAFCQDGAMAVAAAVAFALGGSGDIGAAAAAGIGAIKPWSGAEMRNRIQDAVDMATTAASYEEFRDAYHAKFRVAISCDSRETVPAAFGLSVLAKGDPWQAVVYGANFGRDTDTIACMAGYICGAVSGPTEATVNRIPSEMLASTNSLAQRLLTVGQKKATEQTSLWSLLAL